MCQQTPHGVAGVLVCATGCLDDQASVQLSTTRVKAPTHHRQAELIDDGKRRFRPSWTSPPKTGGGIYATKAEASQFVATVYESNIHRTRLTMTTILGQAQSSASTRPVGSGTGHLGVLIAPVNASFLQY
jgi:hypothetical protein